MICMDRLRTEFICMIFIDCNIVFIDVYLMLMNVFLFNHIEIKFITIVLMTS